MGKRIKKDYTAQQKFQIVLECLTSKKEDAEIARGYGVHPTSLTKWKRQFLECAVPALGGAASQNCIVHLSDNQVKPPTMDVGPT